jgi:hypothetical protein
MRSAQETKALEFHSVLTTAKARKEGLGRQENRGYGAKVDLGEDMYSDWRGSELLCDLDQQTGRALGTGQGISPLQAPVHPTSEGEPKAPIQI